MPVAVNGSEMERIFGRKEDLEGAPRSLVDFIDRCRPLLNPLPPIGMGVGAGIGAGYGIGWSLKSIRAHGLHPPRAFSGIGRSHIFFFM